MADLYTSYETSLALRDAGAPQDRETTAWASNPTYWCDGVGEYGHPIGRHFGCHGNTHPRAFRADEIIEALRAGGALAVDIEDDDEWVVRIYSYGVCRRFYKHESLVEALAAAYLSVLKEVNHG